MKPKCYMDKLPPADKEGLAAYLEELAHDLRFQAEKEREHIAAHQRVRSHRARRYTARDVLKGLLRQGLDSARAVQMAEQQTGLANDLLMKWAMIDAPKIGREKRNRTIMQKAALGWTNAALANHFGLAEKYVQRIISQTRQISTVPP